MAVDIIEQCCWHGIMLAMVLEWVVLLDLSAQFYYLTSNILQHTQSPLCASNRMPHGSSIY